MTEKQKQKQIEINKAVMACHLGEGTLAEVERLEQEMQQLIQEEK